MFTILTTFWCQHLKTLEVNVIVVAWTEKKTTKNKTKQKKIGTRIPRNGGTDEDTHTHTQEKGRTIKQENREKKGKRERKRERERERNETLDNRLHNKTPNGQ